MKINIGKIGSLPLILVIVIWTYYHAGGALDGYIPFIELILLVDIPLVFICLAVWFPGSKGRLWLGRIGTIIWLLILALLALMIVTEFEHADTKTVIIYLVIMISTVIVTIYLWMPRELERVKR